MAMTMADNVIRKACDRCHTQKLSCRRVGNETCERCVRLKTECKYSPSLRYKKQQHPPEHHPPQEQHQIYQHHHQQQHPQHQQQQQQQHIEGAETSHGGRRSPKRRRTETDPSLVPPETVAVPIAPPQAGELATTHHADVTPDSILDLGNFNFTFDQLEFFAAQSQTQPPEHLSHPSIPIGSEGPLDSWNHQLASSSTAYTEVASTPFTHIEGNSQLQLPTQHIAPPVPVKRGRITTHNSSDKRQRPRAKQRARQITLRQALTAPQQPKEGPSVHWMAELSELNASLLDLTSALPQHGSHNNRTLGRPSDERFNRHGFPIDEMFQLTRRVADTLDRLSAEPSDNDNRTTHKSRLDNDPGNSMLVLSTYVRLLDMYQKVFSLVRKELSQTDSDVSFAIWKLPDVTVGSFAVESSPPLQMSLTVQVAEEFLSRLRRSTSALGPTPRSGDHVGEASMFSGVVEVSFQAVKSREESLSRHLAELRGEIEALLDS